MILNTRFLRSCVAFLALTHVGKSLAKDEENDNVFSRGKETKKEKKAKKEKKSKNDPSPFEAPIEAPSAMPSVIGEAFLRFRATGIQSGGFWKVLELEIFCDGELGSWGNPVSSGDGAANAFDNDLATSFLGYEENGEVWLGSTVPEDDATFGCWRLIEPMGSSVWDDLVFEIKVTGDIDWTPFSEIANADTVITPTDCPYTDCSAYYITLQSSSSAASSSGAQFSVHELFEK